MEMGDSARRQGKGLRGTKAANEHGDWKGVVQFDIYFGALRNADHRARNLRRPSLLRKGVDRKTESVVLPWVPGGCDDFQLQAEDTIFQNAGTGAIVVGLGGGKRRGIGVGRARDAGKESKER